MAALVEVLYTYPVPGDPEAPPLNGRKVVPLAIPPTGTITKLTLLIGGEPVGVIEPAPVVPE